MSQELFMPFNIIVGEGAGISVSSTSQIGQIWPQQSIGQAKLRAYINVATGNLILFDHFIELQEMIGKLSLGYVYNSQGLNKQGIWQFFHKKFILLPATQVPIGKKAILQEADGHLTTYTLGQDNAYFAPAFKNGIPHIIYEYNQHRWRWYDPETQITEYYSNQGLLLLRRDAQGRITYFQYDAQENLSEIIGTTGNCYRIQRAKNTQQIVVEIQKINGNEVQTLQTSHFNLEGLLQQTLLPSGYIINYSYGNNNSISLIQQSDTTQLKFVNSLNVQGFQQIVQLRLGDQTNYDITYGTNNAQIKANHLAKTEINFDSQHKITVLKQFTGFEIQEKPEITYYRYTPDGQLQTIIYPDGGATEYVYAAPFNLMAKKNGANQQVILYYYLNDPGSATPTRIISEVHYLDKKPLITYYIYDDNYNQANAIFLRFKISPGGCITEYRPDAWGNIASKRCYFNAKFDTTPYSPHSPIALAALLQWIKQQDASQVTLTTYRYDSYGNIAYQKTYTVVDQQGNGVPTLDTAEIHTSWNIFGQCLLQEVKQNASQIAQTEQYFDDLQRLTRKIDALGQHWVYRYQNLSTAFTVTTTCPNQKTETQLYNSSGLITATQAQAISQGKTQQRDTVIRYDHAGRPVKIIQADGQIHYEFYDRQNRLGYKVTPNGQVSAYYYDKINRTKITTHYAVAINPSQLVPINPNFLPTVQLLQSLLQPNPAQDRIEYYFTDKSNRIVGYVDAENYFTEYFYDTLNRQLGKIAYATKLNPEQLSQLLQGNTLQLSYEANQDRATRFFYNEDNDKIGEQDASGYIIEYQRNLVGWINKKIAYARPVAIDFTITEFNKLKPAPCPQQDAVHDYFYDAKGACVREINAENYFITHCYYPTQKIQQSVRYANKVEQTKKTFPPAPKFSAEDQVTAYYYDLLGRPVQILLPQGKIKTIQYDNMGNIIKQQTQDAYDIERTTPDYQRNTCTQYDGWGQPQRQANAFIGQAIYEIEKNNTISPPNKQLLINKVWQQRSTRHYYSVDGLKCFTVNSLGHSQYFYYNNNKQLIFTIDANGAITENIYNNFNQKIEVRRYARLLPQDQINYLSGGIITVEWKENFYRLRDNLADPIEQYNYDQRGQLIKKIDAEGHITTFSYNAYHEVATEDRAINSLFPDLRMVYHYEPRGLAITIQTIVEQQIYSTQKKYQNLYGKLTSLTNENLQTTLYYYDKLGHHTKTINALNIIQEQINYDAFHRKISQTDALSQTIYYTYNQLKRSKISQYPLTQCQTITIFNVHNLKISYTNSLNHTEQWQHAPDGQITLHKNAADNIQQFSYDDLGRKQYSSNANGVVTLYTYNSVNQLITLVEDTAQLKRSTQYQRDAFGNPIIIVDANQVTIQQQFNHNHQCRQKIVAPQGIGLVNEYTYNALANLLTLQVGNVQQPNQFEEKYLYDAWGNLIKKIIGPHQLALTHIYQRDALRNIIAEIDANQNITRKFYDDLNRLCVVVDAQGGVYTRQYLANNLLYEERQYIIPINPDALNIHTTLKQVLSLLIKNSQDAYTCYYYDANNNERFVINSLGIIKEKRYDFVGNCVHTIGYALPLINLNIDDIDYKKLVEYVSLHQSSDDRHHYFIFSADNKIRFEIDPENYLQEKRYDAVGNIISQILYAKPLQHPQLLALLPPDKVLSQIIPQPENDRAINKVYDNLNRLVFSVNGEGGVTGYRYDANDNVIEICQYAQAINIYPQDYTALVKLLKTFSPDNSAHNRILQSKFDAANRKITDIDALQFVDHYLYNPQGKIITHTNRAGKLWQYQYDAAGRQTLMLTPPVNITDIKASVTQVKHLTVVPRYALGKENSVKQYKQFLQQQLPTGFVVGQSVLSLSQSFLDSCVQILNQNCQQSRYTLSKLQKKCKLNKYAFNPTGAMQLLSKTLKIKFHVIQLYIFNGQGQQPHLYSRHFYMDETNKKDIDEAAIDYQNKNILHLATDGERFVPIIKQQDINANYWPKQLLINDYINLTKTQQPLLTINTATEYDNNGNKTKIITAENFPEPRILNNFYDKRNQLIATQIDNILIDDKNLPASYKSLPIKKVSLFTHVIYNAKNKKVVAKNENESYTFYIYDSEGRQRYTINNQGAIKLTLRNSFNEIIQETIYALPIKLDLSLYVSTGIPLEIIEAKGVIVASNQDRTTRYTRDNRGKVILKQRGPIFYYLPNGDKPTIGSAYQEIRFYYNAFQELQGKAFCLNPQQDNWAYELFWFDRSGRKRAHADAMGKIEVDIYDDAFSRPTQCWEWANPLLKSPTLTTSLTTILENWQPDLAKDRHYRMVYDKRGQLIQKILTSEITQKIIITPNNSVPVMQQVPIENLIEQFTYTPTQKIATQTNEEGGIQYHFYNALDQEIAVTGVARTSEDNKKKPINLVPLTYKYYNAFDECVGTSHFKLGTQYPVNPTIFPQPLALNAEDQTELKLFDNRGLLLFHQNAEQYVSGFTYTPMRHIARQWHRLTNDDAMHIDEVRYDYDNIGHAIRHSLWRDQQLTQQTQAIYNLFGEIIGEGPGDNSCPLYRCFDNLGNVWLTNENKGINTLKLTNLQQQTTLSATSATHDLSQYRNNTGALPSILNWPIADLERLETTRDALGRFITKTPPSYTAVSARCVADIPLNIVASNNYPALGKTSLSWVIPQETTVIPEFTLWQIDHPQQKNILPIKTINGRNGVDVTAFATDVYRYQINYYLIDPVTHQASDQLNYQTQGTVQFITLSEQQSQRLVVEVNHGALLYLTGNTNNLTHIELWQEKILIITLPIQIDPVTQKIWLNLSNYVSGVYFIIPISTDNTKLPATLPFTINTLQFSALPQSRSITSEVSLNVLATYGELQWQIDNPLDRRPVKLTCNYLAVDGTVKQQSAIVTRSTDYGEYTDKNNQKLCCNFIFNQIVQQIQSLSLWLEFMEGEWVLVVNQFVPQAQNNYQPEVIINSQFMASTIAYLTPFSHYDQLPTVLFLDVREDRLAKWKQLPAISTTARGVIVDVTGLAPGIYPFQLNQSVGQLLLTQNAMVFSSDLPPPPQPVKIQSSRYYAYDVWNNIIRQTDTLGNVTEYTYNKRNKKLTELAPNVNILNEEGTTQIIRPLVQYGYNLRGDYIGITDENQHTEAFILNEAGQLVAHLLGDGTYSKKQIIDALGRSIIEYDARGECYIYTFDHRNNVLMQQLPSLRTNHYGYNELNQRASQTNSGAASFYYNYDNAQNIIGYRLPSGIITYMTYDRNHQLLLQKNWDQSQLTYYRNYFGHPVSTTETAGFIDLSGAKYYYDYDFKWQLLEKRNEGTHRGQTMWLMSFWANVQYTDNKTQQIKQRYVQNYYGFLTLLNYQYKINYRYRCGLLVEIDKGDQCMQYDWDTEKRQIFSSLYQIDNLQHLKILIRQLKTYYDNLGRETYTDEIEATVAKYYDAKGNVRCQKVIIYPWNGSLNKKIVNEGWNTFNAADNPLIYSGSFDKANKKIIRAEGWEFIYQQGMRYQQINNKGIETLRYEKDGQLSGSSSNAGYTTERTFDSAGRQISYTRNGSEAESHQQTFDINGWVIESSGTKEGKTTSTNYSNFISGGAPLNQHTDYHKNDIYADLTLHYVGFDEWQPSGDEGRIHDSQGWGNYSSSGQYYDGVGNVNGQRGVQEASSKDNSGARVIALDNMPNGQVLQRIELLEVNPSPQKFILENIAGITSTAPVITKYFYDVTGNVVGAYTKLIENMDENNIYKIASFLAFNQPVQGSGWSTVSGMSSQTVGSFSLDTFAQNPFIAKAFGPLLNQQGFHINEALSPLGVMPFNPGVSLGVNPLMEKLFALGILRPPSSSLFKSSFIKPIDSSYPAQNNGMYVVKQGDTLESIARAMYGDESYATALEFANCVNNQNLVPGLRLVLPALTTMKYRAESTQVYSDFINNLLLSLYPTLKLKQPKQHTGGLFAGILEGIVDLVGGIVGGIIGFVVGGPAGMLIGISAGSTLSDAAYQEIAIQLGWQDHFSLRHAIMVGIEAGITAGLLPRESSSLLNLQQLLLRTGTIAALDQLTEMAIGERHGFDWRQLSIDMITAVIMSRAEPIEEKLFANNIADMAMAENFLINSTQAFIERGLANKIKSQPFNLKNIFEGTLAATVGQQIQDELTSPSVEYLPMSQTPISTSNQNFLGNNANSFFNKNKTTSKNIAYYGSGNIENTSMLTPTDETIDWLNEAPSSILHLPDKNVANKTSLRFFSSTSTPTSIISVENLIKNFIGKNFIAPLSNFAGSPFLKSAVAKNSPSLANTYVRGMKQWVLSHGSAGGELAFGDEIMGKVAVDAGTDGVDIFTGIGVGEGFSIEGHLGGNYSKVNPQGVSVETAQSLTLLGIGLSFSTIFSDDEVEYALTAGKSDGFNEDEHFGLRLEEAIFIGYDWHFSWKELETDANKLNYRK